MIDCSVFFVSKHCSFGPFNNHTTWFQRIVCRSHSLVSTLWRPMHWHDFLVVVFLAYLHYCKRGECERVSRKLSCSWSMTCGRPQHGLSVTYSFSLTICMMQLVHPSWHWNGGQFDTKTIARIGLQFDNQSLKVPKVFLKYNCRTLCGLSASIQTDILHRIINKGFDCYRIRWDNLVWMCVERFKWIIFRAWTAWSNAIYTI